MNDKLDKILDLLRSQNDLHSGRLWMSTARTYSKVISNW